MKIQITSAQSRLEISLFFCLLMRQYIQMILLQVSLECGGYIVFVGFCLSKATRVWFANAAINYIHGRVIFKTVLKEYSKGYKSIKWNAQSKDKYSLHWNW